MLWAYDQTILPVKVCPLPAVHEFRIIQCICNEYQIRFYGIRRKDHIRNRFIFQLCQAFLIFQIVLFCFTFDPDLTCCNGSYIQETAGPYPQVLSARTAFPGARALTAKHARNSSQRIVNTTTLL